MKIDRIKNAPKRTVSSSQISKHGAINDFGATYYFSLAKRVWLVLVLTLPIDLLVCQRAQIENPSKNLGQDLSLITLGFLCLSLLGLIPEKLLQFIDSIRRASAEQGPSFRKILIPVGIIFALTIFEILLRVGHLGLIPVIIACLAIIVGLPAQIKTIKAIRARLTQFKTDPATWIRQLNLQMLYVWVVPIACARLVSLTAAVNSNLIANGNDYYTLYGLLALILILAQKPYANFFLASCRTCATPTARSIAGLGFCPNCAPQRFGLQETKSLEPASDEDKKKRLEQQRLLQASDAKALVAQLLKRLFKLEPLPESADAGASEPIQKLPSSAPSTLSKEK